MEYPKTKLVEEDNTIYEIDLDCMRKKEQKRQQIRYRGLLQRRQGSVYPEASWIHRKRNPRRHGLRRCERRRIH